MRSAWEARDVVAGIVVSNQSPNNKWNIPFIVSWVQTEDRTRIGLCCLTDGMAIYFDTCEEAASYLTHNGFVLCNKIITPHYAHTGLPENRLYMPLVFISGSNQ